MSLLDAPRQTKSKTPKTARSGELGVPETDRCLSGARKHDLAVFRSHQCRQETGLLTNPALFVLWSDDYRRLSGDRTFGLADSATDAEVFYHVGAFYQPLRPVKMQDLLFF